MLISNPVMGILYVMPLLAVLLLAVSGSVFAESPILTDEGANIPHDLSITPTNNNTEPIANTGSVFKFDHGFYDQIQELMFQDPLEGSLGVYDGTRYYNVILVVSRDNYDGMDPDETAKINKKVIVEKLELLGARDIVAATKLSFVTASIPIADIPGFSLHPEIYKIGDGEIIITPAVDTARRTIHATTDEIIHATGKNLDGSGIIVAVIDEGINHPTAFGNRILKHVICDFDGCRITSADQVYDYNINAASHGLKVAQVLAASELSAHNGIAPGVQILDIIYDDPSRSKSIKARISSLAHSLDWALRQGADVVNMSLGRNLCNPGTSESHNLIANEAADKGMILVAPTGNEARIGSRGSYIADYGEVFSPACAYNVIAVGGINDRGSELEMYDKSNRGPVDGTRILKPDLVAPAILNLLKYNNNEVFQLTDGTSFAAPQVSATAAIMLQARPDLTPVQVKAALLLGANWQGPEQCSSTQYERTNSRNNCSYARQPSNYDEANNAASLEILNNVGLGILDTQATLEYVTSDSTHILSGSLDPSATSKRYQFTVTDFKPVKIILTWLVHPHGGILEQNQRNETVPVIDLDFSTSDPRGTRLQYASGQSDRQTNEFAVFDPPRSGTYTITVTGKNLGELNKPIQTFALASTHPLTPVSAQNSPPVADSQVVLISPGMERVIRLTATDRNGDAVSFHVSDDPQRGIVTTDELIDKDVSRVVYTPGSGFTTHDSFTVMPHDGTVAGSAATISLEAETLPPGSTPGTFDSSAMRAMDTLQVTTDYTHKEYSKTFARNADSISQIRVSSVDMEGVEARITTDTKKIYTVAIPASDKRVIDFNPPINIRSVTITAAAIDEEVVFKENNNHPTSIAKASIEYVSGSSCPSGAGSCLESDTHTSSATVNRSIRDYTRTQQVSSPISVAPQGTITDISVTVDISHTAKGNLRLVLTSPEGREVVLHDRTGGTINHIIGTYTVSNSDLRSLVGTTIKGFWTLSVGDYARGDTGTFRSWDMTIDYDLPAPISPPDARPTAPQRDLQADNFEASLSKWTETGEGDWRIATSRNEGVPVLPGQPPANKALHADGCASTCTITLKDSVDLTQYSAAGLWFSRFVDDSLDAGEYLRVQLYDGRNWATVYDWTHSSGDDNTWNDEYYDLKSYLDVSNFNVRFVTHQTRSSEDVAIDNFRITTPDGATAQPDRGVTFASEINSQRSRITMTFSEPLPTKFKTSDFKLSHGTITDVTNFADSRTRHLEVSGIPYETPVTVTYSKSFQQLSRDDPQGLKSGTSSTTNAVSNPDPGSPSEALSSDDFESGVNSWTLSGDGRWTAGAPTVPVPGSQTSNAVLKSTSCVNDCVATMSRPVDVSGPTLIELDRYVTRNAWRTEGLQVQYSVDGGSWNTLASLTGNDQEDNGAWVSESLFVDVTGSIKVRLVAHSYGDRDHTEVDNFAIKPASRSDAIGRIQFDFEGGSKYLTLESDTLHDSTWTVRAPDRAIPDAQSGNRVLSATNCDTYCTATLDYPIDTTGPVQIEFDRYVDRSVSGDEGLYVQFSTNGGSSWTDLVLFTDDNDEDTNGWESESHILDIHPDSSQIRLVAKSDRRGDLVEIDNLTIKPWIDPLNTLNPARITATLDDSASEILLRFTRVFAEPPSASDFELNVGSITSVTPTSSTRFTLAVSDIPYDTPVTVTYVGNRVVTDPYNAIYPGTSTVTNPVAKPSLPPEISPVADIRLPTAKGLAVPVSATDPAGMPILLELDGVQGFAALHDNEDGSATITLEPGMADAGNHTVIITAMAGQRESSESFTITVSAPATTPPDTIPPPVVAGIGDITPPLIMPPPDIEAEATAPLSPVSIGTPLVGDDTDSSPSISNDSPSAFPIGTTTITWTARDHFNNTSTATQTVTIHDTVPPELEGLPQSGTYEQESSGGTLVDFEIPTASDIADPDVTVASSHEPGSLFPIGNTTVTFTATDESGNTASHTITITVSSRNSPIQHVLLNVTGNTIAASWDAYWPDSEYRMKIFPRGERNPTLTVDTNHTSHEFAGLIPETEYRFTVQARGLKDLTVARADASTEKRSAFGGDGALLDAAFPNTRVLQDRTRDIQLKFTGPVSLDYADIPTFATAQSDGNGTITVTTSPTKSDTGRYNVLLGVTSGQKSAFAEFVIRVLAEDVKPPVITLNGEEAITHTVGTAYDDPGAGCTDNVDGIIHIDIGGEFDANTPGTYTLTYRCTDSSGNEAEAERIVIVRSASDTTPPEITAPADITLEATAPLTVVSLGNATATDDRDPNPAVSNNATDTFPVGVTTVVWTATDASGNTAADTQKVTITDTTPPELGYTDSYRITYVDSPDEWRITVDPPTVSDLVDDDITIFVNRELEEIFPLGLTEFRFTVTDDSGNRATANYRLYVVLVPLQLPPVSDIRMTYEEAVEIPLTLPLPHGDDSVSYSVSGASFVTVDHSVSGSFGTMTLNPSASDVGTHNVMLDLTAGKHRASVAFAITVQEPAAVPAPNPSGGPDSEPPHMSAPPDVSIEATAPKSFVHLGAPVVYDGEDPSPAVTNDSPNLFPVGSATVTWAATDASGNTASDSQDVDVADSTPPRYHVSPLRGLTFVVPPEGGPLNFQMAAVTDIADTDVDVSSVPEAGSNFTRGIHQIVFTATDDSENSASITWPIYVVDSLSPNPISDLSMAHDETVTVPVHIPVYPTFYTAFTLVDSPEFASIDHGGRGGNAVITLDPEESDVGDHTVTVRFGLTRYPDTYSGTTNFVVSVGPADPSSPGGSRQIEAPQGVIAAPVIGDYDAFLPASSDLAPVLVLPPDVIVEATGLLTQVDIGKASATADQGPAPVVANNAPGAFPIGTTIVAWIATDSDGNTAVEFQTIIVTDPARRQ